MQLIPEINSIDSYLESLEKLTKQKLFGRASVMVIKEAQ